MDRGQQNMGWNAPFAFRRARGPGDVRTFAQDHTSVVEVAWGPRAAATTGNSQKQHEKNRACHEICLLEFLFITPSLPDFGPGENCQSRK
jgi:hypothetical protein